MTGANTRIDELSMKANLARRTGQTADLRELMIELIQTKRAPLTLNERDLFAFAYQKELERMRGSWQVSFNEEREVKKRLKEAKSTVKSLEKARAKNLKMKYSRSSSHQSSPSQKMAPKGSTIIPRISSAPSGTVTMGQSNMNETDFIDGGIRKKIKLDCGKIENLRQNQLLKTRSPSPKMKSAMTTTMGIMGTSSSHPILSHENGRDHRLLNEIRRRDELMAKFTVIERYRKTLGHRGVKLCYEVIYLIKHHVIPHIDPAIIDSLFPLIDKAIIASNENQSGQDDEDDDDDDDENGYGSVHSHSRTKEMSESGGTGGESVGYDDDDDDERDRDAPDAGVFNSEMNEVREAQREAFEAKREAKLLREKAAQEDAEGRRDHENGYMNGFNSDKRHLNGGDGLTNHHLDDEEEMEETDTAQFQSYLHKKLVQDPLYSSVCESIEDIESAIIYLKMMGDYFAHEASFERGSSPESEDIKERAEMHALGCYLIANRLSHMSLSPVTPTRLSLSLNLAIFYHDSLSQSEKACRVCREAYDNAIRRIQNEFKQFRSEKRGGSLRDFQGQFRESLILIEKLHAQLKTWTSFQ